MVNKVVQQAPPFAATQDAIRRAPKQIANLTAPIQGAPNRAVWSPPQNVMFSGPFMQQNFAGVYNLPASEYRTYLFILNTGAGNMFADFTNSQGPNAIGVLIVPGGFYEPIRAPTTGVTITGTGVVITSQVPPPGA
ncbi:hypothetical protein C4587_01845 [Candidatus Parcubacteria bacterium]|nr:MAG: hypothetical protein C4587_01845 [Candidatus Parcubacteria bacterium]